jgi:hypothetical protein
MTVQEISSRFDILYNNISSNSSPGLNEYEKSVILTQAQVDKYKSYFSMLTNPTKEGFDDSESR